MYKSASITQSGKNFFHPCKLFAIGLMNATLGGIFRSFSWKDLVGIGYLIYLCNRKRGNDLLQRTSHLSGVAEQDGPRVSK